MGTEIDKRYNTASDVALAAYKLNVSKYDSKFGNRFRFHSIYQFDHTVVRNIIMTSHKDETSSDSNDWDGAITYLDINAENECNYRINSPIGVTHSLYMLNHKGEIIGWIGERYNSDWKELIEFGKELIAAYELDPINVKFKPYGV